MERVLQARGAGVKGLLLTTVARLSDLKCDKYFQQNAQVLIGFFALILKIKSMQGTWQLGTLIVKSKDASGSARNRGLL